ncbi:MAG: M15 family metallopeptidase [Saprospiraceae bacterium]
MKISLALYKKYGDPFTKEFQNKHLEVITRDENTFANHDMDLFPRKVYCHSDFAPFIQSFLTKVVERNLTNQFKTWDGCYNLRPIRGYEKRFKYLYDNNQKELAMNYLSAHSWGCAFDFNAAWNRLGTEPTLSNELIQCIEDSGLTWGGRFKRKDGMHCEMKL